MGCVEIQKEEDLAALGGEMENSVMEGMMRWTLGMCENVLILGKNSSVRMWMGREREDNEHRAQEATFDAGLIGPGGVVAEGVENVVLKVHAKEEDGGKTVCVSQESGEAIDLNIVVPRMDKTMLQNEGFGQDNEQDLDPFDLTPIIEAISKEMKGKKWMNTEIECEIGVVGITEMEERCVRSQNVTLYNEAEETNLEGSPKAP
ncbi:hypothetical protein ACFX10_037668 [Malus domestica]